MGDAALEYFAAPGRITALGAFSAAVDELPDDVAELCDVVQGLVIHRAWAPAYGVTFDESRNADAQARSVEAMLERVLELDARPLAEARAPEARFAGTCRDFSVLLCAILRHKGVPARARCGFGTYFMPDAYEDHWICERWDAASSRWVTTDAQIDALQREKIGLDCDPVDMPPGRFLVAGEVWDGCRRGEIDPELCGIFDMHGLWFVRANVARDLASLNRVEVLPWDDWGLVLRLGEEAGGAEDEARVARAATLAQAVDDDLAAVHRLYESDDELRVPDRVRNWQTGRDEPV